MPRPSLTSHARKVLFLISLVSFTGLAEPSMRGRVVTCAWVPLLFFLSRWSVGLEQAVRMNGKTDETCAGATITRYEDRVSAISYRQVRGGPAMPLHR